ncbi:tRNA pseudouridine synthase-like 1 isoform X1 [Pangasianodon hypophthalmus]|uniref:tRNA pseudouridine synthase-like 1 isoform X1 n=1 Tax=Pangasianodon hypophthalmus TaxID=310915 RepID=UPI001479BF49|nr:tRNA pseudouridine synthase-like 1 isoform X1 [Pangasianodon hypophthalmus]
MQQSSTVTRYLIFFQYLGTKYSGVMKAPAHQPLQGVQNHLENAVRRLKPVNEVSVSISSRTDTGVHALCNSAHLDIQRRGDKPPFTERVLTDALNFFLKPEPIRITRVYCVRSDFHARYRAISRTYVYRLATGVCHHTQLPITEKDLCWTLWDTELNVDAMREAGAVLQGTHDFSTFRALSSDAPFKNPLKTMELVQVQPGLSFSQRHFHGYTISTSSHILGILETSSFGSSSLKVRRMVGALVAVGRGKLSVSQVQDLLDTRDSMAYPQNMAAPPYGLFLINVEYNDSDLKPYRGDID